MQFRTLATDDGAVSPVIGVILMVAITVILAAVIGTFVLGMTDTLGEAPPQTSFGFDYEDGSDTGVAACDLSAGGGGGDGAVTAAHEGGAGVEADDLRLVTGAERADWADCSDADATVRAGAEATVDVESNQTLRVAWYGGEGEESSVLGTWHGPDA